MNSTNDMGAAFHHARKLHAERRFADAERAYRQLDTPGPHREPVLAALTDLYLESGRPNEAIGTLTALTRELPDKFYYYAWLASLLDQWGQTSAAVEHYQRFLERQPRMAAAHFNLALLYKRLKRYSDALEEYDKAIELGIDKVQEVYSNMGLAYSEMRKAELAEDMFNKALEIDPDYIPALFNFAGLCEETGRKQQAVELFRRILSIDPAHYDSIARLAYANRIDAPDDPLIETLKDAVTLQHADLLMHEGLYFALGKALDDCGEFGQAEAAYRTANDFGRKRHPAYDKPATSQALEQLAVTFDADWIRRVETDSAHTPVFICGMFRSGSTLVEQLLAGHPGIAAGGELDILAWLIETNLTPYPERAASADRNEIDKLAREYVAKLRDIVPAGGLVTDKRPDNFLHLGLVRAMFPGAKIVYTKRNPLDNCLSIYFQQLGEYLTYATDMESIAHYYLQHEKLMSQWQASFGENIFTIEYDQLVRAPEAALTELLDFLGLDWDERCLGFQDTQTMVKTASVWQVREPLHEASSGRWRNYETLVEPIKPLFAAG